MQATKTLLERALKKQPAPVWRELLELSEDAISVAKHHGRLSPVMAGGMALELGEDPEHWIAIAAIENARESKARDLLTRTVRRCACPVPAFSCLGSTGTSCTTACHGACCPIPLPRKRVPLSINNGVLQSALPSTRSRSRQRPHFGLRECLYRSKPGQW